MSSIPQIADNKNKIYGFVTKFIKRFHFGRLFFKYNARKENGISVMEVFRK